MRGSGVDVLLSSVCLCVWEGVDGEAGEPSYQRIHQEINKKEELLITALGQRRSKRKDF